MWREQCPFLQTQILAKCAKIKPPTVFKKSFLDRASPNGDPCCPFNMNFFMELLCLLLWRWHIIFSSKITLMFPGYPMDSDVVQDRLYHFKGMFINPPCPEGSFTSPYFHRFLMGTSYFLCTVNKIPGLGCIFVVICKNRVSLSHILFIL
jgi:hypothetical protein